MKKKIKPLYLCCNWCGKDLNKEKPHSKYCGKGCSYEAVARK